jgi:hypothetical protein
MTRTRSETGGHARDAWYAGVGQALDEAEKQGVSGARVTPFLLARVAQLTSGTAGYDGERRAFKGGGGRPGVKEIRRGAGAVQAMLWAW